MRSATTTRHFLVGIDGSDRPTTGLQAAAALARRLGGSVSAIDCLPDIYPAVIEEPWLAARTREVEDVLEDRIVERTDDVVGTLLRTAAARPGTTLCLSSHGRSGVSEVVLGSVTRGVVLGSPTPVLVAGPRARVPETFDRVQLCWDGRASEGLLEVAAEWSSQLGAELWLTHVADEGVVQDGTLHWGAEAARGRGIAAEWDVLHGRDVAAALADWAGRNDVGLLVVGARRHGLPDRVAGTVTSRLVQLAPCPVLVVGPQVAAR